MFLTNKYFIGDVVSLSKEAGSDDESGVIDEGKIPSFCVLLHGGLKVGV